MTWPRFSACTSILLVLTGLLTGQTSVRVNVGGPQYTDSNGAVWQADTGCSGGTNFTSGQSISGTADPTLYQTGKQSGAFSCLYTVTGPAFYYVTTRFAETSPSISPGNPRIFNVFVNNVLQATVNIVGNGGAPYTASDLTFGPIAVYGTSINILFSSVSNAAEVQAIDIEFAGTFPGQLKLTGYGTGGPFCNNITNPDGIELLTSDQLHELAGADCYGEWFVRSESDSYKRKVGMVGRSNTASTNQAAGLNLSSDAMIQFGNQTDLAPGNSYDACFGRVAPTLIFGVNCTIGGTTYNAFGGKAYVFLPGSEARPTCSSSTRGWMWATQGVSMTADTVAVCAKDNMDAYAWRTIY